MGLCVVVEDDVSAEARVEDDLETWWEGEAGCEGRHELKDYHDDGSAQWRFHPNCDGGCKPRLVCDKYRNYVVTLTVQAHHDESFATCPYCQKYMGVEYEFHPLT